jgi:hypothetical protein
MPGTGHIHESRHGLYYSSQRMLAVFTVTIDRSSRQVRHFGRRS